MNAKTIKDMQELQNQNAELRQALYEAKEAMRLDYNGSQAINFLDLRKADEALAKKPIKPEGYFVEKNPNA